MAQLFGLVALLFLALPVKAANRADVERFLQITGFDVAVESIAQDAEDAPEMLGLEAGAFGATWSLLADEIFDVEGMMTQAVDILEQTLDQELLDHAVGFYDSALGQRLVKSENLSVLDDGALKQIAGQQIIAEMVETGDPKIEYFQRMNVAIDPEGVGLRAMQQIQVRFLVAASRAGVIEEDLDEEMLWSQLDANRAETLRSVHAAGLAGAAYTYQGFSADEILAYTEALEHPKMQTVYELMNAVHYQIMGDRFDEISKHLDSLQPSEEL
ncbi:DUF2059 domain-containing protein [Cognatishimia sp. SS12]|nr:DUF2059 domain-containing protein [Cognatishimia sp. SS12]